MKFKGIELQGEYKVVFEDIYFQLYDEQGYYIYYENSYGFWAKREHDGKGNFIYFENSNGYWWKREYDEQGNEIYFEDSDGVIRDRRPKQVKEHTMKELHEIVGYEFKITKEKE